MLKFRSLSPNENLVLKYFTIVIVIGLILFLRIKINEQILENYSSTGKCSDDIIENCRSVVNGKVYEIFSHSDLSFSPGRGRGGSRVGGSTSPKVYYYLVLSYGSKKEKFEIFNFSKTCTDFSIVEVEIWKEHPTSIKYCGNTIYNPAVVLQKSIHVFNQYLIIITVFTFFSWWFWKLM